MNLHVLHRRRAGLGIVAALLALLAAMALAGNPGAASGEGEGEGGGGWNNAAYIKFDGIDGESTDDAHKDWIDVSSVNQVIHRPSPGGAGGAARASGSVVFDDIVITKAVDKSSPKLAEAVATGKVFPEVKIELTVDVDRPDGGEGRTPYLVWKLENVQVTNYSFSGTSGSGERPMEEITLNFSEIEYTYTQVETGDQTEFSWNVTRGGR